MADLKKLAEQLTALTVLEVNELKNVLKDEYGIEPATAAAAPASAAGPATATAAAAGSMPYSSLRTFFNSFTSKTVKAVSCSASFFKSAIGLFFRVNR